jgi:hypothetical protein
MPIFNSAQAPEIATAVEKESFKVTETTLYHSLWTHSSGTIFTPMRLCHAPEKIAEAATNDEETSSVMFHYIHCIARPDPNARLNATVRLYRIAHIEWRTAEAQ